MARFRNGFPGSPDISFQSADLIRTVNLLGSKVGRDTIANTSPVRGSSATTAPFLPSMASSATACRSRSIVSCRFLPGMASFVPRTLCSRPRLSTIDWRSPSTPISVSLYWRSMPNLPITSPELYLANSGLSSSPSLISPV